MGGVLLSQACLEKFVCITYKLIFLITNKHKGKDVSIVFIIIFNKQFKCNIY